MPNLPQIIGNVPIHCMRKFFHQIQRLQSCIDRRKEIVETLEFFRKNFRAESTAQVNEITEIICNLKYTKTLTLLNNYYTSVEVDLVKKRLSFVRKDKNSGETYKLVEYIDETKDIEKDYGDWANEKWEYHKNFFEFYSIYASNLLFMRGVICEFVKETDFIEKRVEQYKAEVWHEQFFQTLNEQAHS